MKSEFSINKNLIWDYDFEGKYDTEEFKKWYLARVLTRGSAQDIRLIGLEMIRKYLPSLNLPEKIRKFWSWWFDENTSINKIPEKTT
ncbi:MAG: hypothetical protein AB1414_07190 [bacterium]